MSIVAFLLPIALGLGLLGLAAFFWAAKNGQFEDLDGAAMRILIDDEDLDAETKTGPDESDPAQSG